MRRLGCTWRLTWPTIPPFNTNTWKGKGSTRTQCARVFFWKEQSVMWAPNSRLKWDSPGTDPPPQPAACESQAKPQIWQRLFMALLITRSKAIGIIACHSSTLHGRAKRVYWQTKKICLCYLLQLSRKPSGSSLIPPKVWLCFFLIVHPNSCKISVFNMCPGFFVCFGGGVGLACYWSLALGFHLMWQIYHMVYTSPIPRQTSEMCYIQLAPPEPPTSANLYSSKQQPWPSAPVALYTEELSWNTTALQFPCLEETLQLPVVTVKTAVGITSTLSRLRHTGAFLPPKRPLAARPQSRKISF